MEYALSDRGEVVLRQRPPVSSHDAGPPVLELRVNGVFVMDTAQTGSERALASTALSRTAAPHRVLVGGLGLGFTAQEVLADPRVQRLVVVELEEALVGWMRDGVVPHGPPLLADERLTVVTADIRQAVAATAAAYDLVLLDVDNGPGFLVYDENAAVYRPGFLSEVARVLRPGGVAAVWSMAESAPLAEAMVMAFGSASFVSCDVRLQEREEQYWL